MLQNDLDLVFKFRISCSLLLVKIVCFRNKAFPIGWDLRLSWWLVCWNVLAHLLLSVHKNVCTFTAWSIAKLGLEFTWENRSHSRVVKVEPALNEPLLRIRYGEIAKIIVILYLVLLLLLILFLTVLLLFILLLLLFLLIF